MEGTSLLSLPEGMQIEQIQITENGLVIAVVATSPTSCCPLCSEPSSSIHCHYRRVLRDAPCAGRRVLLFLTVRKFSCRNPYCSRKVFAERFPDFVEPWKPTQMMLDSGGQHLSEYKEPSGTNEPCFRPAKALR